MLARILAAALVCLAAGVASASEFTVTLPIVDTQGAPLKNMKSCRVAILDGTTATAKELVSSLDFDVPATGLGPDGKALQLTRFLSVTTPAMAAAAKAGMLVCKNTDGEEGTKAILAGTFRVPRPGAGSLQIAD